MDIRISWLNVYVVELAVEKLLRYQNINSQQKNVLYIHILYRLI